MSSQQTSNQTSVTVNGQSYTKKDIEKLNIGKAQKDMIVKYLKVDVTVAQQMLQMAIDNAQLSNDNNQLSATNNQLVTDKKDLQSKLDKKEQSSLPFFQKEIQWKDSKGNSIKGTGMTNAFLDNPLIQKKTLLKQFDAGTWSLSNLKTILQILYQRDLLSVEYKEKLDNLVNQGNQS